MHGWCQGYIEWWRNCVFLFPLPKGLLIYHRDGFRVYFAYSYDLHFNLFLLKVKEASNTLEVASCCSLNCFHIRKLSGWGGDQVLLCLPLSCFTSTVGVESSSSATAITTHTCRAELSHTFKIKIAILPTRVSSSVLISSAYLERRGTFCDFCCQYKKNGYDRNSRS